MRFRFSSPALFPTIAVSVLLMLVGCSRHGGAGAGPTAIPVTTAPATLRAVPRRLTAIGTVQPLRTVTVKSQVDGMIQTIHFHEGDEVKAGALLVTLDRRPFENAVRIARADLVNARAEAARAAADGERYATLDKQAAISKEQLAALLTAAETSQTLVLAKEAAVANAELQLSYAEIRAPIAGRTGQLALHEGALVKANDAAFSIVTINQIAPIAVAFGVPERTFETVHAAIQSGTATVEVHDRDNPLQPIRGAVDFIDNAVDSTTGMILLKATFPNADHQLWPGRFVDVELQLGAEEGRIVVPAAAVQNGQQGPQVFVVRADHTVDMRPVVVARTDGDLAVIGSGLQAGETVVTDGQFRLVPGARVDVTAPETIPAVNAAAR